MSHNLHRNSGTRCWKRIMAPKRFFREFVPRLVRPLRFARSDP